MRYAELVGTQTLEEALVNESFLGDLAKLVGNKAKQQITVVNNAGTTAAVLYKVCSNPSYLETVTFELKRMIKGRLKTMPDSKLRRAVASKFPQGRSMKDFFAALALISVLNSYAAAKGVVQDQALNVIIGNVLNLDALIGHLLSAGAGALGMVFKALGVGNTVLFDVLTTINKKITHDAVNQNDNTSASQANPNDKAA